MTLEKSATVNQEMSGESAMESFKTLLVEDEASMSRLLQSILAGRGHEVTAMPDAESAMEAFRRDAHSLIVLDLNLPGMDGLEFCRRVRATQQGEWTTVVVVTSRDKPEDLQAVLEAGANDYLSKPIDPKLLKIRLAIAEQRIRQTRAYREANERVIHLEEQVKSRGSFEGLIGKSEVMQEVFRRVRMAAESDVTVLVLGESGTGKELVARGIHSRSARKDKPFVAINCSAIPETLLESELFGHVRGAFTGAIRDKEGVFKTADGGTLFLDEIGDMNPDLQVKLLRVLQEKELRRVGDSRETGVDVRLICATNRDLSVLLSAEKIREDFYFRIRVFEIILPPLRERREDIPILVTHFLSNLSRTHRKMVRDIARDALHRLMNYPWPGNVRELQNVLERAIVAIRSDRITLYDLPNDVRARPLKTSPRKNASTAADREIERKRVIDALKRTDWNQTGAAKILGVSRITLWKKIRNLNIRIDDLKQLTPPPDTH